MRTRATTSTSPTTAPRLRRKRRAAGAFQKRASGPGTRPAVAATRSAIADLGVESGVRQVDEQVDEDERDGDEQDRALYQGQVAAAYRVDEQPAHPRP